jgi:hypothetical protein
MLAHPQADFWGQTIAGISAFLAGVLHLGQKLSDARAEMRAARKDIRWIMEVLKSLGYICPPSSENP